MPMSPFWAYSTVIHYVLGLEPTDENGPWSVDWRKGMRSGFVYPAGPA
jgi:hypothetical protein